MQSQNKRNTHFMIAKEVFIDHILGQIEEQYELNSNCLGEGGFGQVFEGRKKKNPFQHNSKDHLSESFSSYQTSCRWESDQHNVSEPRAIKRISFKKAEDKELMRNEMEILSYLDHPLIVKLYQTFQHKKNLYLVIDLLKGGDLFTVIDENQKLQESEAKLVFVQLIKALNYLHCQHICHRDLKLENILFLNKDDFNLKLVDFGLAFCWDENMRKEIKQKGLHKKMTGTPDYMAPEMLSQSYDQRCDIWAAGVILYILLSGVPPFQGSTDKDIMQRIKNFDYTFEIPQFDGISLSAKDLIEKILKPQNERISIKEILKHPWMKEDSDQDKAQTETGSVHSHKSERKIRRRSTGLRQKTKTFLQNDRKIRKCSQHLSQDTESQVHSISHCSEDMTMGYSPQQLTVSKLEHYSKLSMLQKLQAIFAVSKLSQTRTKKYGEEFLAMDKDNDGTISLQDFTEYMNETQGYEQSDNIESYFNEVALSQRGYLSYTEYLACVLAYHGDLKTSLDGQILEFDDKFSENGKTSLLSDVDTMASQPIDIFDDSMLYDLFCLLDKNGDGLISEKDFIDLLENSGIESLNEDLIEELTNKIHELCKTDAIVDEGKESNGPWFEDPRKYKWQLSRTYKGESDGGSLIDFKHFKHLMKGSQACFK